MSYRQEPIEVRVERLERLLTRPAVRDVNMNVCATLVTVFMFATIGVVWLIAECGSNGTPPSLRPDVQCPSDSRVLVLDYTDAYFVCWRQPSTLFGASDAGVP